MKKALLLSTNENAIRGDFWTNLHRLDRSLSSASSTWSRAANAEEADIVLFTDTTDPLLRDVRRHTAYLQHREKVMVNCDHDVVFPLVPGLYTSLRSGRHNPQWSKGGFYVKVVDHDWITAKPMDGHAPFLCSFVGSFDTHPVRRRLVGIERKDVLVRDTSTAAGRGYGESAEVYEDWKREYARNLSDSKFVLCPRGVAPSSYRIFEAMKAGRVPVIISDDWVAPVGPDWEQFSLRVEERDIERVADICIANAGRAADMGRLAEQAFADCFSADACATTILDRCLAIRQAIGTEYRGAQFRAAARGLKDLPMLRNTLGPAIKRLIFR